MLVIILVIARYNNDGVDEEDADNDDGDGDDN